MSNEYIAMQFPEIQDYMERPDYKEKVYYDCDKDMYFVPKEWVENIVNGLTWKEAQKALHEGKKIKLPEWNCCWRLANGKYESLGTGIVSEYKGEIEPVVNSRIYLVEKRTDFIIVEDV